MSTKINLALAYASEKHKDQVRKLTGQPYILHPMEVATIIATLTNDEDVMCAGLLHDVIEDCKANAEEIKSLFGERVYNLVLEETEDKKEGRSKVDTWKERKEESLQELASSKDINVKILWLSDKLSNVRSLYRAFLTERDNLWNYFNQSDKKMHEWYYRSILEYTSELKDTFAYKEFDLIVGLMFDERAEDEEGCY